MRSFVSRQELVLKQRQVRRYSVILALLCLLTLGVFVAECLLTRTGNAAAMLRTAYVSMILMGFACMAFASFFLFPARRKARRLESLLSREPEVREGRFTLTGQSFQIPKSARVRAALLETGEETLRLNLDEEWVPFAPPDGSPVRVQTVGKFITGIELPDAPGLPENRAPRPASRIRRILRQLLSLFPALVLWVMAVLMFGGFVFNQITDTAPRNKIVVYADCELRNAPELAEKLEQALDGKVRMVKIHPFSYAMFDTARISRGDLYLVPDSHREEYRDWFAPGEEGTVLFDPAAGVAAAEAYFLYVPEGGVPETYRLYTGGASVHLEDGLARRAAELLAAMTEPVKEENP